MVADMSHARRTRTFFSMAGFLALVVLSLTGCGGVTPYPIPTFTAVPTATPVVTQAWVVQSDNDCLISLALTPGKSKMEDVKMKLGEPSFKDESPRGSASWHYDTVWYPLIRFEKEVVNEIVLYPKNCRLGDVIEILGPPDVLEVITLTSCIDLSQMFNIQFHYFTHGVTYVKACPFGSVEEECRHYRPSDTIGWKEFYSPESPINSFFYYDSDITEWVGFSQ